MAQQKKPPTPLPIEQHSSSSDDEEQQVSGEVEVEATRADSSSDEEVEQEEVESSESDEQEISGEVEATRAEEEVEEEEEVESSGSDDEEEDSKPDSSESEEDEEHVTPLRAKSTPKVRAQKQKQPDLAPATAPAFKKRPREDSKAVSKKSKKRVAEEVVKRVVDSPKSKLFQRVFSEDDEIELLKALLDYSAEKCIHPIEDFTDLYAFVKKYIHIDVDRSQLSSKIKKMKSKYKNNAAKTEESFRKDHDKACYDLSKKIWGKSDLKTNRKGKRIPKMKNMTPGLQIPQVVVEEPVGRNISLSELAKTRDVVGLMGFSDDLFKKGFELLGDEARAAMEEKWKKMVTAEFEFNYKRLELSRQQVKLCLDALGHRG